MNCPALINSIGLLLDVFGVILLFCYGLPPDVDRRRRQFLTWGKDEEQARKGKRFDRTSRLTLGLLIFGFTLQIISNWIQRTIRSPFLQCIAASRLSCPPTGQPASTCRTDG